MIMGFHCRRCGKMICNNFINQVCPHCGITGRDLNAEKEEFKHYSRYLKSRSIKHQGGGVN